MVDKIEQTLDVFQDSLVKVQAKFFGDLATVYSNLSDLSEVQLLKATREISLFELLLKSGYTDSVKILQKQYDAQIKGIMAHAKTKGVPVERVSFDLIEGLKNLELENTFRSAAGFSMEIKQEMFASLVAGEPTEVAINSIIDKLGPSERIVDGKLVKKPGQLASHQARVAANDSIRNFISATRRKTFEKDDTVRWEYVGPISDNTRDACMETLSDPRQDKGWTLDEIDAHSSVTFADGSSVSFIDRGGFNCQHDWHVK